MALPGDVTTTTITFGPYTDAKGLAALVAAGGKLFAVDPSSNRRIRLTHIASGQVIVPEPVTITIASDGTGSLAGIPHTGQATISPTGYAWRVEWNLQSGDKHPSPGNLTFVVPSGATTDFDLLVPAATVPAVAISQPTVASVAGLTGAPTAQQVVDALATPLSVYATDAELTAGLATKVNSSTYTAGLAAKQDVATLAAATAPQVSNGSALDVALRAASDRFTVQAADVNSRGGRVALIGDSITSGPLTGSPYNFYPNARGRYWHDWWFYLAQQQIRSVGNWAVGAKDLQHCRDVQLPNVFSGGGPFPDAIIIAAGTNNWDRPIDEGWAVFLGLVNTVALRGVRPILTTIPPHTPSGTWAGLWNARVRAFAATTGLTLIERNTPVKGASEDLWASGMTDDGIHPNDNGHRVIGVALAATGALTAAFLPNPPGIATDTGADTFNLARPFWSTSTGWTFAAGMGQFWGTQNGWPALVFNDFSSSKIASFTVTSTSEIEVSMGLRIGSGGTMAVRVQPQDAAAADLSQYIPLVHYWAADSADRYGMILATVKPPAGTAKYKVIFESYGTNWIERPTIREIRRLA